MVVGVLQKKHQITNILHPQLSSLVSYQQRKKKRDTTQSTMKLFVVVKWNIILTYPSVIVHSYGSLCE